MVTIPDFIGLIGVFLALGNHFCMLNQKIKTTGALYNIINLFAGAFVMVSLMYSWNLPSFVVEICWFAINGYGLFMSFKHKKKNDKSKSKNTA